MDPEKLYIKQFEKIYKIYLNRTTHLEKKIINSFYQKDNLTNEQLESIINDYHNYINNQNNPIIKETDTLKKSLVDLTIEAEQLRLENELIKDLWKNGGSYQVLIQYLQFLNNK